jgi:hypothetical protein
MSERPGGFGFEGLPLAEIRPGTSVLVTGPTHEGSRDLALRMLRGPPEEAAILITTNQRASRVADDCRRLGIEIDTERTAILDCVGTDEQRVPARVLPVSGPSDLTGIGMRFSDVQVEFGRTGHERVRTGLLSVSTLLSFSDLRTVSRFVHTLVGRIDSVDGLGVLFIDPGSHDERAIRTLAQFCAGRIEVREGDDGPELRARGLADQSREWEPFDLKKR